ncbi:MAG: AAA family ATPase [Bacteriovoracaceae bacterium]|nr:AAA family ATPase [Bacteriovoracaceae bacterium]
MYLSTKLLSKCFFDISNISEKDEGKTRQEKVSQLRYILALSALLKAKKVTTIKLSPEFKELRNEFIFNVGTIVSINQEGTSYTKDFKYFFGDEADYSVSSNFLTTAIKKDRSYPGSQRGIPAIKIKKESLELLDTLIDALDEDYHFKTIGHSLAVWITRFNDFKTTTLEGIENEIIAFIKLKYTKEIFNALSLESGFLKKLITKLEVADNQIVDKNVFDFNEILKNQKDSISATTIIPNNVRSLSTGNLNFIFYGPPGTGKTYEVINYAVRLILGDKTPKNREEIVKAFNELRSKSIIEFVTFHQSFSYEDFIEGLTPVVVESNGVSSVNYEIKSGVLKRFLQNTQDISNPYENIVLVIDEINRGNISSIFGELISLLEPDKREGALNGIPVTLPYSKDELILPKNLYILGTMNSTDRSIAMMDFAIRRRFEFIYLAPDLKLVPENVEKIQLRKILEKINKQIVYLIGKDYQLGQSFFLFSEMKTKQDVKRAWFNKLLPVIGEYFYEDWEKLALIVPSFIVMEDIGIGSKKDTAKIYRFLTIEEVDDENFVELLGTLI